MNRIDLGLIAKFTVVRKNDEEYSLVFQGRYYSNPAQCKKDLCGQKTVKFLYFSFFAALADLKYHNIKPCLRKVKKVVICFKGFLFNFFPKISRECDKLVSI